jgi:DNA mismatch endonuclease (patch repair protein)
MIALNPGRYRMSLHLSGTYAIGGVADLEGRRRVLPLPGPPARTSMVDIVDRKTRSRIMRAVRREGTTPENVVGACLRGLGLSYRRHVRDLPGSPDFANRRQGWALFVNGCFWHGHRNCTKTRGGNGIRVPDANHEFWEPKLRENRRRDARKCRELRGSGFRVMLVWECQTTSDHRLRSRLAALREAHR